MHAYCEKAYSYSSIGRTKLVLPKWHKYSTLNRVIRATLHPTPGPPHYRVSTDLVSTLVYVSFAFVESFEQSHLCYAFMNQNCLLR